MKEFFTPSGIYYRISGPGPQAQKTTLVFVHGLTGSASSWAEYEKALSKNFNILNLDLRGHGKSKRFKKFGEYAIVNFAEDIFEITSGLGVKNFVLISHSFGTLAALEFLLRHKGMARSAVFLSPNFSADDAPTAKMAGMAVKAAAKIAAILPARTKSGRHIDYSKFPNASDWDMKLNIADIGNTGLRTYFFCLRHIYETDCADKWSRIDIPTLIIHGKKDTVIPARHASGMAKKIPQCELVFMENGNHLFVINEARETIKILEKFLDAQA